jgi:peptide/nickel transport system permease protein
MSLLAGLRARTESGGSPRRFGNRVDWTLLIGLGSFMALLGLALYGPLLAPHDFYYVRPLINGRRPPFAPGAEFPLGSDEAGHDLLSWLLIGARSTLVIAAGAAALRMLIGGFLGTFAGWQGGRKGDILTSVALALSSIPATVLAVLSVLAFNIYAGTLAFTVALGLLGWGEAFHHARRHARAEGARPFIESARALGMSETRVVLRHLLPSMAPSLLTLSALQISAVLLLLGELGLIRLFVGGAEISELDPRTGFPTAVTPTQPDWSSMLAQTRPIISLYGTSWTILVPGLALLVAVVGTNLLGDALARRAQRQDLYRLFSRGQALLIAAVLVGVTAPALAWPSRLSADLEAATPVDGARALAFGHALADPAFRGRLAGTSGALAAAEVIRRQWNGELQPVTAKVSAVTRASVRSGDFTREQGVDLTGLSLQTAGASGTLRDLDRDPPRSIRAGTFAGQILVTSPLSRFGSSPSAIAFAATQGEALAVIVVDDDIGAYRPSSLSALIVRMGTNAFREMAGALPVSLDASASPLTQAPVQLSLTVQTDSFAAANVVARALGPRSDVALIVVFVPYDEPPYPSYLAVKPSWGTASAVGVASEVLGALRRSPVAAEVVFVAVGGDSFGAAGTTAFIASLSPVELRRVIAAVTLGSLQSGQPSIQVETAQPASSGPAVAAARVGGRVGDALGLRIRPTSMPLRQALQSAPSSIALFGLSDLQGAEAVEPSPSALHASARDLVVLLSYIANHPEEVRP